MNEKRATFEAMLARGRVAVLLDARQPGVAVPSQHAAAKPLILNFSQRFDTRPEVSEWGVRQVLTFQGAAFGVQVPWGAIYGMQARDGQIEAWLQPEEPPTITKRRGILGVVN